MHHSIDSITNEFEILLKEKYFSQTIKDAFYFALRAHSGQFRKFSNDPYLIHPFRVMKKILPLNPSEDLIIAALLHDVVEDTNISIEEIDKNFGSSVASMVMGLTKSKKGHRLMNLEQVVKVFPEVMFIKIADRLDNVMKDDKTLLDRTKNRYKEEQEVLLSIIEVIGIEGTLVEEFKTIHFD